jgi:S1-C subfamily serine protease
MLLTAGVLAVAALWVLARFRFQDLPATPNPIPAVLSQLTNAPKYEDLASEIAQLQPRLEPLLLALNPPSAGIGAQSSRRVAALRFRADAVVALLPTGSFVNDTSVLARDPASDLAVVRVLDHLPSSLPVLWTPRRLQQPRYLIASDVSAKGVPLRPVFVGSLEPVDSPFWPDAVWTVPERSDLATGSFLFTGDAEFVGMVTGSGAGRAIVPGAVVLAEASRLAAGTRGRRGTVGIEVQALTEPVASITGASAGVVVTWVEPGGAASGHLMVGDVIEAADGRPLATRQHWDVRHDRLTVGETLTLRVRRGAEVREVVLAASAAAAPPLRRSLGLTLRERPGIGAEVIRVDPGTAGSRAGLEVGDRITLVGAIPSPSPAQVRRSFSALSEDQRMMIAVTRGDAHHVSTLER